MIALHLSKRPVQSDLDRVHKYDLPDEDSHSLMRNACLVLTQLQTEPRNCVLLFASVCMLVFDVYIRI